MNKTSTTKKQQIVLVFIGAAVVVAALWSLVVRKQYAHLATVQQKTQEVQEKVSKAENLLKRADEIANSLDNEAKKLETIEDGMASGDIYLWAINTVNQFNHSRSITVLDFQRENLGDVGSLPQFPYKAAIYPLKGVAHYHDLGKFLAEFENKFPYVRVQNLELTPVGKTGGGEDVEKLSFKFEIVALIKPNSQ